MSSPRIQVGGAHQRSLIGEREISPKLCFGDEWRVGLEAAAAASASPPAPRLRRAGKKQPWCPAPILRSSAWENGGACFIFYARLCFGYFFPLLTKLSSTSSSLNFFLKKLAMKFGSSPVLQV